MIKTHPPCAAEIRLQKTLGVSFSQLSFDEVLEEALLPTDTSRLYVTCNLNHLRVLQDNSDFQRAYQDAHIVTVDGQTLRFLAAVRADVRLALITGADLFPAIIQRLNPAKHRPFFICSVDEVGRRLVEVLTQRGFAPEAIAYVTPDFGFENDPAMTAAMLQRIQSHGPTHLFFGVGAPKSEIWVSKHLDQLPPCQIFSFGAALAFAVDLKKRAPRWMRKLGLEWLHRLSTEPTRLSPRYLLDALFLARIVIGRQGIKLVR